jgi:hypothetical protein
LQKQKLDYVKEFSDLGEVPEANLFEHGKETSGNVKEGYTVTSRVTLDFATERPTALS